MASKTTTQKLDIRWQDRSWQMPIRRADAAAARRSNLPAVATVNDSARAKLPASALVRTAVENRPCRSGVARRLVKHIFLAFRPRRRK